MPLNEDEASKDSAISADSIGKSNFMPFQVRERMQVAPCVRRILSKSQLVTFENKFNTLLPRAELYLEGLKNKFYVPGKSEKASSIEEKPEYENDVIFVGKLYKTFSFLFS